MAAVFARSVPTQASAQRRRAREHPLADLPAATRSQELAWRDLGPVLDEEIHGLPPRYRVPFILCYLEGRSTAEAARVLGCAQGTVFSRLAWARERLRVRLARRDVDPWACLLAALPAGGGAITVPDDFQTRWRGSSAAAEAAQPARTATQGGKN
jgi:hypothetical protein